MRERERERREYPQPVVLARCHICWRSDLSGFRVQVLGFRYPQPVELARCHISWRSEVSGWMLLHGMAHGSCICTCV